MTFCAKHLIMNMYLYSPVDHTELVCVSHLTVREITLRKLSKEQLYKNLRTGFLFSKKKGRKENHIFVFMCNRCVFYI